MAWCFGGLCSHVVGPCATLEPEDLWTPPALTPLFHSWGNPEREGDWLRVTQQCGSGTKPRVKGMEAQGCSCGLVLAVILLVAASLKDRSLSNRSLDAARVSSRTLGLQEAGLGGHRPSARPLSQTG